MVLFFKNTTPNENVGNVTDLKYMKILKKNFNIFDFWPEEDKEKNKIKFRFRHVILVEFTITLLLGTLYLKNNFGKQTFYDLGHTYITVFMNVVSLSRLLIRCFKRSYDEVGQHFINKIHLFHFKSNSEYEMQMHLRVHKISHNGTVLLTGVVFVGVFSFNLISVFNNITTGAYSTARPENVTLEQSVYYALPFDYTGDIWWYLLIAIFNCQKTYICTSIFIHFDLWLSLMIIHLWGHLKILIHFLDNIPKPSDGWEYTREENEMVFDILKKCVERHNLILNFTGMISEAYGISIFVYYCFHQVTGCLLLFQCAQSGLTTFGILTLVLNQQLVQLSCTFELLSYVSDNLQDSVYCVPWEYMTIGYKKNVYTMLMQAQIPIQFKALNMVTIGVATAATIMKTSVSYYLMLKTFAE